MLLYNSGLENEGELRQNTYFLNIYKILIFSLRQSLARHKISKECYKYVVSSVESSG